MHSYELQVSFRHGKPLAAYLYLFGAPGGTVSRTSPHDENIVVDYLADGRPFGVEFIAPGRVSLEDVNALLVKLHLPPMSTEDLRPLLAA